MARKKHSSVYSHAVDEPYLGPVTKWPKPKYKRPMHNTSSRYSMSLVNDVYHRQTRTLPYHNRYKYIADRARTQTIKKDNRVPSVKVTPIIKGIASKTPNDLDNNMEASTSTAEQSSTDPATCNKSVIKKPDLRHIINLMKAKKYANTFDKSEESSQETTENTEVINKIEVNTDQGKKKYWIHPSETTSFPNIPSKLKHTNGDKSSEKSNVLKVIKVKPKVLLASTCSEALYTGTELIKSKPPDDNTTFRSTKARTKKIIKVICDKTDTTTGKQKDEGVKTRETDSCKITTSTLEHNQIKDTNTSVVGTDSIDTLFVEIDEVLSEGPLTNGSRCYQNEDINSTSSSIVKTNSLEKLLSDIDVVLAEGPLKLKNQTVSTNPANLTYTENQQLEIELESRKTIVAIGSYENEKCVPPHMYNIENDLDTAANIEVAIIDTKNNDTESLKKSKVMQSEYITVANTTIGTKKGESQNEDRVSNTIDTTNVVTDRKRRWLNVGSSPGKVVAKSDQRQINVDLYFKQDHTYCIGITTAEIDKTYTSKANSKDKEVVEQNSGTVRKHPVDRSVHFTRTLTEKVDQTKRGTALESLDMNVHGSLTSAADSTHSKSIDRSIISTKFPSSHNRSIEKLLKDIDDLLGDSCMLYRDSDCNPEYCTSPDDDEDTVEKLCADIDKALAECADQTSTPYNIDFTSHGHTTNGDPIGATSDLAVSYMSAGLSSHKVTSVPGNTTAARDEDGIEYNSDKSINSMKRSKINPERRKNVNYRRRGFRTKPIKLAMLVAARERFRNQRKLHKIAFKATCTQK